MLYLSSTNYQGDSGTITITFYSSCPDQLQISSAGIQFDWTTTPNTETVNSPNIATGNQYPFNAISFSIPSDASVGSHSFTLSIQGQQKGLLGWYSISATGTGSINVLDAYQKVYNQLVQTVSNSLTNAQNSNNLNSQAQAFLQQAESMFNQATSLSQQGEWQAAVNDLNSASNYLSQVAAQPTLTPAAPEFPATAFLAIFLVLSFFAAIMLTVKKRKAPNTFKG